MSGLKVADLTLVNVCQLLRQIGREDHNQLIFKAERAFYRALQPSRDYDWSPSLTRYRRLEAEGRDILRAYLREQRAGAA